VPEPPARDDPRVEIVLYVNPVSAASARARRNLETVLEGYDPFRFRFVVRDVSQELMEAEADHIVFTPTLVVRARPAPSVLVGDLADAGLLKALLSMRGLEMSR
jgi:hypothetical protein